MTDFVCLNAYEFWLSLCKIVRSSVILLLPLFITNKMIRANIIKNEFQMVKYFQPDEVLLYSTSMRTNLHSLVIGNFLILAKQETLYLSR